MAILEGITGGVSLLKGVATLFQAKEPTPEEQKAKAGVWYRMLQYYVTKDVSDKTLRIAFLNQLPFKQKSTKERFFDNNIMGQSKNHIIDVLIEKINDELVKGGFTSLTRNDILSGMGVSDFGSSSGTTSTIGSPNPVLTSGRSLTTGSTTGSAESSFSNVIDTEVNESRNLFYGFVGVLALIGVFFFTKRKPKRRR